MEPLRILALNWRDPLNPEAGGAETHLHEILRRLAARGHAITWLAAGYPGGAAEAELEGLRILRAGAWWNANWALASRARRLLRDEPFDLIVEDVNKIPFYMPLVSRLPHLLIVPHLFGATVFRETNPLGACYVYAFESLIPRVYRKSRVLAISPSTREDLIRRGLRAERIAVSYCGFDAAAYDRAAPPARGPAASPRLIHLGRLRRYKGADIVLRAFARVRRELPAATLDIVGSGPEEPALRALAARLGLEDGARFHGFVSLEAMVDLLYRSHLFLNASPKEGWGLTVIEAAACGVPTVAADSPGLRDSVVHDETGLLVPYGDDAAMAEAALALLRDDARRARMGEAAARRARTFSWDRAADEAEGQIRLLMTEAAGAAREAKGARA